MKLKQFYQLSKISCSFALNVPHYLHFHSCASHLHCCDLYSSYKPSSCSQLTATWKSRLQGTGSFLFFCAVVSLQISKFLYEKVSWEMISLSSYVVPSDVEGGLRNFQVWGTMPPKGLPHLRVVSSTIFTTCETRMSVCLERSINVSSNRY